MEEGIGAVVGWAFSSTQRTKGSSRELDGRKWPTTTKDGRKRSLPSPRPNNNPSCVDAEDIRLKCGSIASAIHPKQQQSPHSFQLSRHLPSSSSCLNILPIRRDHIMATANIMANRLPSRLPNRHTDISIPLQTFQFLHLPSTLLPRSTPRQCTHRQGSLESVWIPIATCRKAPLTITRCKSPVLGLVALLSRACRLASRLFPVLGVNHRRLSKTISRRP